MSHQSTLEMTFCVGFFLSIFHRHSYVFSIFNLSHYVYLTTYLIQIDNYLALG